MDMDTAKALARTKGLPVVIRARDDRGAGLVVAESYAIADKAIDMFFDMGMGAVVRVERYDDAVG